MGQGFVFDLGDDPVTNRQITPTFAGCTAGRWGNDSMRVRVNSDPNGNGGGIAFRYLATWRTTNNFPKPGEPEYSSIACWPIAWGGRGTIQDSGLDSFTVTPGGITFNTPGEYEFHGIVGSGRLSESRYDYYKTITIEEGEPPEPEPTADQISYGCSLNRDGETVSPNTNITLTADVTNNNPVPADVRVTFGIDGNTFDQTATISANSTKSVSFQDTLLAEGTYSPEVVSVELL
jgi:hypothetical protein